MKFREVLRFEFVYQARRVRTWAYFVVLFLVAYLLRRNSVHDARSGEVLNSPFAIAMITVMGSLLWVLIAAAVAGSAAARDVQTRMHPLTYTAPVSKAEYLAGRFLAAFVLNALILLAVPAGILFALLLPGVEPEMLGPFWPAAYLSAYVFIALPTAFAATAIQFSLAALNRRAVASYLASVFLVVTSIVAGAVVNLLHMPTLGKLLDPIGYITVVGLLSKAWTPIEKNTLLIGLEGSMLANGVLWVGIGLGMLGFTHVRFRFGHHAESTRRSRAAQRRDLHSPTPAGAGIARSTPISVPQVRQAFGFATHARQTLAIAWTSFGTIAKSGGGLVLLAAIAIPVVLLVPGYSMGVPLLPRTAHVLTFLTAPLTDSSTPWVIIPLLIVFYAGELVWREREAGLSEIADTTPVPEWVVFLGKFLGLSLVLVVWMSLLTTAGVLAQVRMGHFDFEIGLYLQILFGLQLIEYLLFALLVFVVQAVVNQKHLGYLVALIAYGVITFPSMLGIEHNLLVYGSDPGWSYSDIRGFGPFLGPWLWFKLYWAAWALLLAVVARLLWVRGREPGLGARFKLARHRFTRPTVATAATAVALIVTLGGFIFYNTNVLNAYETAADRTERRAEYERRYGRYEGMPQPWQTGTSLHVEIYPERQEAEIRGTYRLVNDSAVAIESIHLATAAPVETRAVSFDRAAAPVVDDEDLGHRIYALEQPLQPGDSLQLSFEVHVAPHGFRNNGVDAFVVENGTYFTNEDWLPSIGYQSRRELNDAGDRRAHGLAPRPAVRSLYDAAARRPGTGDEWIAFEAVVGTEGDQVAIAPGALRQTWTEGGRRYFRYSTDAPIRNRYAFFSADYAVHEGRWNDVAVQIFHHPGHTTTLDRMVASVRASLDYYTRQFGPYPYSYLRLVENPVRGMGAHAEATTVEYGERGFSLLNPGDGPQDLDLVFAVVAHEVAHQWWGAAQLRPAHVEGAPLLAESLATYSAMQVVEETLGHEHLRRYLSQLRADYEIPRTRASVPLLRAYDRFLAYRKGPFALYAMREYIGKERVDDALRRLFEKHGSGAPPLPTSLDLYRELQAVTPDSFQYLLHDLFEKNTFWELETERATAEQTDAGTWQVTLEVDARKVVVDTAGTETDMPMHDLVEIGVYAPADAGEAQGAQLYLAMHRIATGPQTITVTVPQRPARAGIDPRHLLIDVEPDDNLVDVTDASPQTD